MNRDSHIRGSNASGGVVSALLMRLGSVALWSAALASIAASAWLGFAYGYQFGLAFGAIAVCAEVFKPVAVQLGFQAIGNWRTAHRALLFLPIAFVCVVYSLLAELGLSAAGRGDLVAERQAESRQVADARADRQRYLDEMASIKNARPLAEMRAVIASARTRCRVVVNLRRRETVCSKSPKLLAELARAERRAALETKLAQLPATAGPMKPADPLADTLATLYLDTMGAQIEPIQISKWLYLVPVVLIEVCSAFGLMVAAATTPRVPAAPTLPSATVASNRQRRLPPIEPRRLLSGTRQPSLTDRELVVAALRSAGRPLNNNELAAAMGVHKSEASRRVAGLNGIVRKVRVGRTVAISLGPVH